LIVYWKLSRNYRYHVIYYYYYYYYTCFFKYNLFGLIENFILPLSHFAELYQNAITNRTPPNLSNPPSQWRPQTRLNRQNRRYGAISNHHTIIIHVFLNTIFSDIYKFFLENSNPFWKIEINTRRTTFAAAESVMVGNVRVSVKKIMCYNTSWMIWNSHISPCICHSNGFPVENKSHTEPFIIFGTSSSLTISKLHYLLDDRSP
jgi:hypothetical protein